MFLLCKTDHIYCLAIRYDIKELRHLNWSGLSLIFIYLSLLCCCICPTKKKEILIQDGQGRETESV